MSPSCSVTHFSLPRCGQRAAELLTIPHEPQRNKRAGHRCAEVGSDDDVRSDRLHAFEKGGNLLGRQIQIVVLLGAISIGLAIEGFRLLKIIGRPAASRVESANLAFENTTTLVTVGAYRWIRHPLYASLLALAWSAWLKNPLGLASIVLTLGASGFLLATALAEEEENLERFGAAYGAYKKRTRRFIPFVF